MTQKTFQIQVHENQTNSSVSVLALSGCLDGDTFSDVANTLKNLIAEERLQLVFDLKKLKFIDSAGIGVIARYGGQFRLKNGDICFCNVPDSINRIFNMVGFNYHFKMFSSEEEAASSLIE